MPGGKIALQFVSESTQGVNQVFFLRPQTRRGGHDVRPGAGLSYQPRAGAVVGIGDAKEPYPQGSQERRGGAIAEHLLGRRRGLIHDHDREIVTPGDALRVQQGLRDPLYGGGPVTGLPRLRPQVGKAELYEVTEHRRHHRPLRRFCGHFADRAGGADEACDNAQATN